MKSSEYWKKRALFAKKKQLEASADYEAAMQSRLRDLEHDIEKEALGYLQRYANENHVGLKQAASVLGNINSTKWSMTLEEFERKAKAGGYEKELNAEYYKSRIFRLQQLHEQMVEFSKKYGMAEQLRMQKGLANQYQNSYYLDAYNKYRATGQLDIKLNHFNEQQLENIVYRPWKGSDFSKRIWKEYTEVLPDELTDALLRGTLFGYSPNKVVRMMRDRFQRVSERDLHRLVITEMGHAAEEATAQFYKDSNIEQYQYLATLESHTCDQCAHLDERIFNVKDKKEGINYPLIHPYCRCTTVPYDKALPDIETRWSRDPETEKGTYVRDMNYQQWERMTSQKTLGYQDWKKITGVKILSLGMLASLSTPKLSLDEKKAVTDYVSPAAYDLNDRLRNGYSLTKEQKAMVEDLDTALEKLPVYTDKEPLQRSLTFIWPEDQEKFLKDALKNGYIQEKSYTSSIQHGVYDEDDGVRMIINRSHSGRDLKKFTLDGENEVLFKRNTKFILKDLYQKDGKFYLEVVENEG
ncbi:phage head morphogenesis protein [Lactobacillus taiwanensis]|uniref:minor capsid protein n=1 Tax=Lactobacillus taiwanensis TaxID=508451 RepID=UPI000B99613B|nr:minor capsid protein [Lactobacillus taiwanensis]OYS00281.1 phage head morphogenesis protein [Lactobacillus taiwanensis]OYS03722.1 phage head morphogenesis protein [Lactobacillus taiwanensis]